MRRWLLLVWVCACHPTQEAEPERKVAVHCVALVPTTVHETLMVRGRIEPPPGGDLVVASQVPGRIDSVVVREGQHVARGDEIASINDVPPRDALRQAEASLAQTKAAEMNTQVTLERVKVLVDKGIAAKQELDDAIAHEDQAKANVAAAEAALHLARTTLGRVSVRSSFDGVITRIFRGPGALVDGSAQTPIAELAAQGVELVADVTERELLRVAVNAHARVSFPSGAPDTTGTVRTRSSALDPATGLGVVRITLDDVKAPIGAFGHATLDVADREGVPVVPATAVRGALGDGAEVVRCVDGKADVVRVGVGYRDDKSIEITSGLAKADRVAVDHVLGLGTGTELEEAP